MANTVIALKKSAIPSSIPIDLANGELAINYADGKLYYKAANGTIASISGNEPNFFGSVNADGTLVIADTPSDIFTLEAGENITIIGDAINDKITISATVPGGGDPTYAFIQANTARNSANLAYDQANAAYDFANTVSANAVLDFNLAYWQAVFAFDQANAAYLAANNAVTDFSPAFIQANTARSHANAAFATANSALPNTSGVTFDGNLTVSQNLTATRVIAVNNGEGENFKIGNDVWIGDVNIADTLRIKGQQNTQHGYISFGDQDTKLLGRAGTGQLTWDNEIIWHQGNDGSGSGLDADLLDGFHGTHYGTADNLNAAYTHANNAFNKANTANITADRAWNHANAAFISANIAFANANIVMISAQAAFTVSNASFLHANAAFASSNANYAFSNSAHTIANLAFAHANAAFAVANTSGVEAEYAFLRANLAHAHANAAFLSSNSVNTYSDATYVKLSAPSQTITGNLAIVGGFSISGNTTFINAESLRVADPLLYLAGNNYISDIVDIGFIANYVNATGQNVHTGLYREHENKEYYLFQGYDAEPANNHIGALSNNMTLAVLNADLRTSNIILGGANAIVTIGAAFTTANTARTESAAGFLRANLAHAHANASFATVNSAFGVANAALPSTSYTASDVLSKLLTVDGAGSGLDADLLDGQQGTYYGIATDVTAANRVANAAFLHANASYAFSNSAHTIANLAFAHANAAFLVANTSGTEAEAAFLRANLAHTHANAAYLAANTARTVVNDNINATRYLMFANGLSGTSSSNVALGLSFNPSSNTLNINGPINAITKSFVIPHPSKEGMFLRYGSLEGPENGVYVRGKLEGKSIIELPDYWWNLIDESTITVNLTPIGRSQDIWVQSTSAYFINLNQPANCYFTVYAERKDVDKLVVEY